MREIAEKYAEDEGEYKKELVNAVEKMTLLGHEDEQLTSIEHFLKDDPYFKVS